MGVLRLKNLVCSITNGPKMNLMIITQVKMMGLEK